MVANKKQVLDFLYETKAIFVERAFKEDTRSFQLPETDVSGRNLAAGASRAFTDGVKLIDAIIVRVIELRDE